MNRIDALKSVVAALHAEIAALKSFDIDALARATQTKDGGVGMLADWGSDPITAEVKALAQEAAMLNETSRIYVNLMSANIRSRLEALTGMGQPLYTPRSAAA